MRYFTKKDIQIDSFHNCAILCIPKKDGPDVNLRFFNSFGSFPEILILDAGGIIFAVSGK